MINLENTSKLLPLPLVKPRAVQREARKPQPAVTVPRPAPDANHTYQDDAALVQACLAGNQSAWNELVERYQRLVYSIPRKYGLSEADAEDVMQNVFIIVYRRLSTLRDQTLLAAWLIRITHRVTLHHRKSQHNHSELDEALADENDLPDDQVARLEAQNLVHRALAQLDPHSRELLKAFLQESPPSYEEIAKRLGCPVGSIGPTRARSFKKLEAILLKMGVEVP
jgi:RNA polymerase sigma factor (sigma-70 family)